MKVSGVICEYNPLHKGHEAMLRRLRQQGAEAIVCAMSGNFVQRGEPAIVGKRARAEMALRCGADLVLEIPTPWSTATAETFARGGVEILRRTGVVTELAFGSESGDVQASTAVADALDSAEYQAALSQLTEDGRTFAARRQAAVAQILDESHAALLERPNDILAVEYIRALRGTAIQPAAILRAGADHDAAEAKDGSVSASYVRRLLQQGRAEEALGFLPDAAAKIMRREIEEQRAPADLDRCERAVLDRLRRMDEEDFAAYDGGGEGLYHRVYRAARECATVEEWLDRVKTKRYTHARLRRMLLAIWLDLKEVPERLPYIRLLGANETGRRLLRQMYDAPILTKAADVGRLGREAEEMFSREARWSDLYALTLPVPARCGEDWRMTPVMIGER